jgi:hypothetical protein
MISGGETVVNWSFGRSKFCNNCTNIMGIAVINVLENQHIISNDCTRSSSEK